jgi:hypothetical protein
MDTETFGNVNEETSMADQTETRRTLLEWQVALLPLMSTMLIGLTVFFFIASFVQLRNVQNQIVESPKAQLDEIIASVTDNNVHQTSQEVLLASELQILASLESYALDRRYHQANVFLMSRVWTRYLGFVTGMILALIGSSFVLGKMRGDSANVHVSAGGMAGTFQGTESGLLLAVLGVALMMTTLIVNHPISTEDAPVFMQVWMRRELPSAGGTVPTTDSSTQEEDYPASIRIDPAPGTAPAILRPFTETLQEEGLTDEGISDPDSSLE